MKRTTIFILFIVSFFIFTIFLIIKTNQRPISPKYTPDIEYIESEPKEIVWN